MKGEEDEKNEAPDDHCIGMHVRFHGRMQNGD